MGERELHQHYGVGTTSVGLVVIIDEDGNITYYDYNHQKIQGTGKLNGKVVGPVNVSCDGRPHDQRGEVFVAVDGVGTVWVGNARGGGPNPVPVNGRIR